MSRKHWYTVSKPLLVLLAFTTIFTCLVLFVWQYDVSLDYRSLEEKSVFREITLCSRNIEVLSRAIDRYSLAVGSIPENQQDLVERSDVTGFSRKLKCPAGGTYSWKVTQRDIIVQCSRGSGQGATRGFTGPTEYVEAPELVGMTGSAVDQLQDRCTFCLIKQYKYDYPEPSDSQVVVEQDPRPDQPIAKYGYINLTLAPLVLDYQTAYDDVVQKVDDSRRLLGNIKKRKLSKDIERFEAELAECEKKLRNAATVEDLAGRPDGLARRVHDLWFSLDLLVHPCD